MASNSFQGNNSYLGTNSVQGVSSLADTSRLENMLGNRRVNVGNIVDTGLRDELQSALGTTGKNSYSKFNVPTLNELNDVYGKLDRFKRPVSGGLGGAKSWDDLLSNATYGLPGGYTTQDIGGGKYNILDASGANLGLGYYDPRTAANQMMKASYEQQPSWQAKMVAETPGMAELLGDYSPYASISEDPTGLHQWGGGAGGALADWEVLGQILGGAGERAQESQWGSLPLNSINEKISGANTLYGSTPVFYNGKLVGYKSDLGSGLGTADTTSGEYRTQTNPFGYQATHLGKSHSWSTGLGREFDPAAYSGLVKGMGDTSYFVPLENVDKLPGWTNLENYKHVDQNYGGLLHEAFKFLDPILDTIDPLHNQVQKWTTGSSTTEGQSPYFQAIAPAILSAFFPAAGAALGSVDALSRGDNKALLSSIAGYGLSGALNGMDLGYGNVANAAASGAIKGGVSGAIGGGDFKSALKGALMGGLGGGVSGSLSGAGPLAQIAAQGGMGALNSLLSGKGAGQGALSGLLSGAVGSLSGQYAPSFGKAGNALAPIVSQLISRNRARR